MLFAEYFQPEDEYDVASLKLKYGETRPPKDEYDVTCLKLKDGETQPFIQQDDNYREQMGWITEDGLRYGAAMCCNCTDPDQYRKAMVDPDKKRNVVVVGAGVAGLVAAFELAQIGHDVKILEVQSRVGGRIKTIREGFDEGLHAEAGAMRIPQNHYLTHHYFQQFGIKLRPFQNFQKNAYVNIDGQNIRMQEFMNNNRKYSDKFWSGWDVNIPEELRPTVNGVVGYFEHTVEPVIKELGANPSKDEWNKWVEKWSKFSIQSFLRSTEGQDGPWPEIAIQGYMIATYSPMLDDSLVAGLREHLGGWWRSNLQTPVNGMDGLPKAFTKKDNGGWNKDVDLSKCIQFGIRVEKVEIVQSVSEPKVKVYGKNTVTGEQYTVEGDVVFITVPLPILRQLKVPLSSEHRRAVSNVSYAESTKIMMQCRTRFWQKTVGQGGFSKTDLMIGQLHYPDYDKSRISEDERGVLLVYTWGSNAVAFGGQPHQEAIKNAVAEISQIHPEMEKEFEVGCVQSWQNDPTAQGAFAALKPYEYLNSLLTLATPEHPIYLAGEALSWSNGWIQGALFSGLLQALNFQKKLECTQSSCKDFCYGSGL